MENHTLTLQQLWISMPLCARAKRVAAIFLDVHEEQEFVQLALKHPALQQLMKERGLTLQRETCRELRAEKANLR